MKKQLDRCVGGESRLVYILTIKSVAHQIPIERDILHCLDINSLQRGKDQTIFYGGP